VTRFSGSCYLFIRIPGSANIFDDIPKTSIFIANVDSNDDSRDINNFITILIKFILIQSILFNCRFLQFSVPILLILFIYFFILCVLCTYIFFYLYRIYFSNNYQYIDF